MPFELPELNRDFTGGLEWMPGPGPELIPPDPEFAIPFVVPCSGMGEGAVLIQYDVFPIDGMVIEPTRFTNQVMIAPMRDDRSEVLVSYTSFESVNLTGWCVNDLHLSLTGIHCAELLDIYNSLGWQYTCIDNLNGCEITFYSIDGTCLDVNGIGQFSFAAMGSPQYLVNACYWTWNGTPCWPFVDFVNQTWMPDANCNVVDIVWGYDPIVDPQGVLIQRDFSILSGFSIPLPGLTWDETAMLPWEPADWEPIMVPPDPDVFFPFIFEPWQTDGASALLIRYEVMSLSGVEPMPQIRFTNEALVGAPPPPPPVIDLRINLIELVGEFAHFELNWSPVPGAESYHIYQLGEPYNAPEEEIGWTVDSFFDVFVEIDIPDNPPKGFFKVTTDTQSVPD